MIRIIMAAIRPGKTFLKLNHNVYSGSTNELAATLANYFTPFYENFLFKGFYITKNLLFIKFSVKFLTKIIIFYQLVRFIS